jgi:lipoprotein-releasing system ATP-binding protein
MESGPVLVVEGLEKSFIKDEEKIPVIRGLDFSLKSGEMVAVTGSSGAGKSTLLHILGTLEPPTSGKVLFGQEKLDLFSLSEKDLARFRNRSLGFVFQFHYLLPEFTALENVMMPAMIAGFRGSSIEKQARELLEFVGLKHRLNHRPSELSGGEQQRVAVARAVVLRPKLLLADELTGNLDSKNSERMVELLRELNRATGVSILLVTHDQSLAQKMHRIISMRDGKLVEGN